MKGLILSQVYYGRRCATNSLIPLFFPLVVFVDGDGKLMKEFKKDPVKYLRYFLSIQLRKDGVAISRKLLAHYMKRTKKFETVLSQVYNMTITIKKCVFIKH